MSTEEGPEIRFYLSSWVGSGRVRPDAMEALNGKENGNMKRALVCMLLAGLLLGICTLAGAESRNLVKLGGDLVVGPGMEPRDAVAIGGDVQVEGSVERHVVAVGGSISLGPEAQVGGDVISIGGIIEKEEGAQVRGNLVEVTLPGLSSLITSLSQGNWREYFWPIRFISIIASIGLLALSLVIVSIFPKPVGAISATIETHTLKAIGWGLLGILLVAPIALLLAISIVGIVLIPLEIVFVICGVLIGYIAAGQLLGKKITVALRKPNQPMFWETLWGLIFLTVIGWVPFLGHLVKSVAALVGWGGVIYSLVNIRRIGRG